MRARVSRTRLRDSTRFWGFPTQIAIADRNCWRPLCRPIRLAENRARLVTVASGPPVTGALPSSRLLKKASATAKDRVENPVQTVENKQWSDGPVFMVFRGPQAQTNRPGGISYNKISNGLQAQWDRPPGQASWPVGAFFSSLLRPTS